MDTQEAIRTIKAALVHSNLDNQRCVDALTALEVLRKDGERLQTAPECECRKALEQALQAKREAEAELTALENVHATAEAVIVRLRAEVERLTVQLAGCSIA
jgi:hypothetical protein